MGSLTNSSTKIEGSGGSESEISSSAPHTAPNSDEHDERASRDRASIALPAHVAGSGALDRLIDTARDYAEASTAENTNKAYAADWKHFTTDALLADPYRGEHTRRSLLPLEELDALDLMDGETELAPGVTAFPTPGHTPGHMSLLIASRNERALLVGDILGSPMQATETDFHYSPDWDGPMGIAARRDILDRAEREGALVIGSHFSYPGWGAIIRWEGRRCWKAL